MDTPQPTISGINQPPHPALALYVHWPWCKKKCPYCDFNSHVNSTIPEDAYITILLQQLMYFKNIVGERTLTSIFFGGGTPSLMSPQGVEKIILGAKDLFKFDPRIEITLEANPTSSDQNKLKNFIQAGVNRLSIGMQGLDPKGLIFLGREHSTQEAIQTVENSMEVCENVNLDLIYGLPEQRLDQWKQQLAWAIGIGSHHISAYQLTIEPNTAFYGLSQRGQLLMPTEDIQADFYEATTHILEDAGYLHYEISNYSKLNQHCRHNQHVWNYAEYIGIGAGAHGRIRFPDGKLHATQGKKLPQAFMAASTERDAHTALAVDNIVTPAQMAVENILMSLRTAQGVDKAIFVQTCGFPLDEALNLSEKQRLIQLGIISETECRLVLNKAYWLLLDHICINLIK